MARTPKRSSMHSEQSVPALRCCTVSSNPRRCRRRRATSSVKVSRSWGNSILGRLRGPVPARRTPERASVSSTRTWTSRSVARTEPLTTVPTPCLSTMESRGRPVLACSRMVAAETTFSASTSSRLSVSHSVTPAASPGGPPWLRSWKGRMAMLVRGAAMGRESDDGSPPPKARYPTLASATTRARAPARTGRRRLWSW
jgi:hypothetical protein